MEITIRPYHPSDLPDLYRICLLTGDNGQDASSLYQNPDLLGLYYVGPYVTFEPNLCFVLTLDHQPCGYVLGTQDTAAFRARTESDWFPILRQRFPLPNDTDTGPDAQITRMIHRGRIVRDEVRQYPAHLHIDVLPVAQGQGWGKKLMELFIQQLKVCGATGLHLGVSQTNSRAVRFYERCGLWVIKDVGHFLIYGKNW